LVGRSGWTWKGTFYRKNLRNILLMWPLIFSSVRFSPACVFILLLLLLRFFIILLSLTHTHTYIYYVPSLYTFSSRRRHTLFTRDLKTGIHIILYTHTHRRRSRTLYIIFSSSTDRQIVRFSSPARYSRLYNNIHALLKWHNLHQDCVQVDTACTDHITMVATLQYNLPIYIYIFGLEWTNI